jgi:hypothetical protein
MLLPYLENLTLPDSRGQQGCKLPFSEPRRRGGVFCAINRGPGGRSTWCVTVPRRVSPYGLHGGALNVALLPWQIIVVVPLALGFACDSLLRRLCDCLILTYY